MNVVYTETNVCDGLLILKTTFNLPVFISVLVFVIFKYDKQDMFILKYNVLNQILLAYSKI